MIETNMDFYGTFGATELSPGKDRQAKVNRGGVQRVEFVVEAKTVPWRQAMASGQQLVEQCFVKCVRLTFIDPRQGGTRYPGTTEVVKLSGLRGEIVDNIAKLERLAT